MKTEISEYEKQATNFLTKIGATFEVRFLRHGKHFTDDKESRDIYDLVLKRDEPRKKSLSVEFGASLNSSGFYYTKGQRKVEIDRKHLGAKNLHAIIKSKDWDYLHNGKSDKIHYPIEPTCYDLLTCLTKSDPGSFDDFCSEYGYNNDSIKHKHVYESVIEEWKKVEYFFSSEELEQLQEIN